MMDLSYFSFLDDDGSLIIYFAKLFLAMILCS